MTTGNATKRPGGRTARVRRAVFDATLDLLALHGYQALTVEAVAAAAGVNKATIYRNWSSKTELLLAVARDRSEELIRTESTGNPEGDLIRFLASVAESISSPVGQALILATINGANDPQARASREEFWRARFQAARPLIREATKGQSWNDHQLDGITERLIGPVFLRVFITGTPLDDNFIRATARAALAIG